MPAITDKFYLTLSERAYKINHESLPNYIFYKNNGVIEKWKVVNDSKLKITDSSTGFDAFVVQKDNQVVISYRGTQGDEWYGAGIPDLETDVEYIVMKQPVHQEVQNNKGDRLDLFYEPKKEVWYKKNQFQQAEALVKDIKAKYPDAEISVTGHSLGGALAQYTAARFNLTAVTYSAPSVVDLLDKKTKKKAIAGNFDTSITNYVHPKDSIGAGGLKPYERHIGSTYYIGTQFDYENWALKNQPIERFFKSVTTYHKLEQYQFDKYGNLYNPVIFNVLTGMELLNSPRYTSANSGLIEVIPADLRNAAKTVERTAQIIMNEFPHVKARIQNKLIDEAKRHETQDIGYDVMNELIHLSSWLEQESAEFSHYLKEAADKYEKADKLV